MSMKVVKKFEQLCASEISNKDSTGAAHYKRCGGKSIMVKDRHTLSLIPVYEMCFMFFYFLFYVSNIKYYHILIQFYIHMHIHF